MDFNLNFKIGNHLISKESPIFIIAEAGVNHNGDMELAKQLIDIASSAGADAVKFQTFKAEELILKNVPKASYQTKTTKQTENQFDMLKKLEVSKKQNIELMEYCKKKDIIFLTTPFEEKSLDELDELDLPAYKVASTDLTNIPFLIKVAKKNKPIFLSSGMSYLEEIKIVLDEISKINKNVVLLHCTANYPINDSEANLNVLDSFKKEFDMLLGYSDHTVGIGAAPYSVAKGVQVIEKHFTISHEMEGPDHKASLSPKELVDFVCEIRRAETYMGTMIKIPTLSESFNRLSLQKCLVAKSSIKVGEKFSENNIIAKRTGGKGISPIYFNKVVNTIANRDYAVNEIITID